MAHPLGARTGIHHGLANAVLLPFVLETNRDVIVAPAARLGARLGLRGVVDPVAALIAWVRELTAAIGLPATAPTTLSADDLPALVAGACGEALYLATNPRKVTEADIGGAYRGALGLG
jgi:alcohol dehydrogenase class IV